MRFVTPFLENVSKSHFIRPLIGFFPFPLFGTSDWLSVFSHFAAAFAPASSVSVFCGDFV
jgi:hypothetical protein